ncbi:MAG: DNA polymerase I [Bacilli bacterium]|nr:DNA polymerase I [Bacilli bacterium]
MKKVILIDGNNILFRSYYATAYTGTIMRNSKGFPTNALYGFINMINKIINEERPSYVMIAFDKGKTFRHDKYEVYKDGRRETPSELKEQFPVAKRLVEAMGIACYEIDNYEADDIIGTFARCVDEDKEYTATIISSDKDLLQLISDEVDVKLLKQTGFIRMDRNEFINTYGVEPARMVDLKALMGDASDNIPGVKGIGEKTAINLLKEYGTLENLYNNIDSVKGKMKEKLIDDKENAFMSYDLATIYKEVPIDTDFEKIKYRGIDALKYIEILEELEFYSLLKKVNIDKDLMRENETNDIEYTIVDDLSNLNITSNYSIYLETLGYNYHKDAPIGLGIYDGEKAYYVPFSVLEKCPNFLESSFEKYTYDVKKLIVVLDRYGIKINNLCYDAMIAGYLLNLNVKDDIGYLMNNKGYKVDFYLDYFGNPNKLKMPDDDLYISNIIKKAKFLYESREELLDSLKKEESYELYNNIELPLAFVLADMELTGIKIDQEFLRDMGKELDTKIEMLEDTIHEYAGKEFNISSPKQLAEVLFIDLGIPYPKRTKDNSYSTSKEILDKIVNIHPIIPAIMEYRLLSKLNGNYVIGLLNEVHDDGKIHTMFNQTLTRTGRLSSSNPNLQNLPIRQEYGKCLRKAFIPEENSLLLSSDYSQIELRIFAHMANAKNLIEAFKEGKDIHTKTASDIFGVSEDMVTKEMRHQAKAVNFGILYGISSFGLGEDLNIDYITAKNFITNYLNSYPEIKLYMDNIIKEAYEKGFVKTIMNRKRTIEELSSKNYMIRTSGERIALNTPIQGSSADILKKAMVEIYDEFKKRNLKSKMLIQVHDELVINTLEEEIEEVEGIVKNIMENTYKLEVPLKVEISTGNNLYDAK